MLKNKVTSLLLILALVLISGCTAGCGAGYGSKKDSSGDEPMIGQELTTAAEGNYKTTTVTRGDYAEEKMTGGALYYPITEELSFDKDNCRIEEIKVAEGDVVSKGDVLITFTCEESELELEELELSLQQMEDEYEDRKQQKQQEVYDAYDALSDQSSYGYQTALCEYQKKQIAFEQYCYSMEHCIEKQKESIKEVKKELKRTSIKAPFDGRISKINYIQNGDDVKKGATLMTIQSEETILVAGENPNDAFGYHQEVEVTFTNRGAEKKGTGIVVTADNVLPAESKTGYIMVRMNEDFDWSQIEGWRQVNISIKGAVTKVSDVLIVDKNAVALEDGDLYVEIYEDGVVHKRVVQLGCVNNNGNGSVVWITAGLSGGEEVVLLH